MNITSLGEARFPSPLRHAVSDQARIPAEIVRDPAVPAREEVLFELAGPRDKLFFDPMQTRAGVVTCGGLCPGLNNVVRALFFELHHTYGVAEVLGFRGGYHGLDPARGQEPTVLTPAFVDNIHKHGGTILGTSRGPVDMAAAVDNLIRRDVHILFTVGGDGTQRGGHALFQQAKRQGHALSVVGVPKTIDNDVAFVAGTFGYLTAVEEAVKVLTCAHTEARSVHNGLALVKLMGRHAGFIAAQDDPWEKFITGEITHFQALAEIFACIRTTEADLLELADSTGLDAGFAKSARVLQDRGWELVIASAGCDWYIKYLLKKAGVSVSVHANPGTFDPERGLEMSLPERSPFFSPTKGVNKVAIVRDALSRSDRVAFAGDGRPDLKSALLVQPQLRFARGWLGEALSERGEGFHPFERWSQIADQLQNAEC